MTQQRIRPMIRTGQSANITYYREPHKKGDPRDRPYVWAEVLRSGLTRNERGEWQASPPVWHFTVCRYGTGVVAEFKHGPTTRMDELSARTVTTLVRRHLSGQEEQ